MSDIHHSIPFLIPNGNHYQFEEEKFRKLIEDNGVKDLPVVVISIAGAFRGGKSFLMSFFIKILSTKTDENWLSDSRLAGFSWKGGTKGHTAGMIVWSKIFKILDSDGNKVAVMLMDTQGTFDQHSSTKDDVAVFGLSTLLSSVQIYNISHQIDENHLQHLLNFVEFARIAGPTGDHKPFQSLLFLIRDWCNVDEYQLGKDGGGLYLAEKLSISQQMNPTSQRLREGISSTFDDISCFLLPHPGLKVAGATEFDLSVVDPVFLENVERLVPWLMDPQNLVVKRINGEVVTCQDLVEHCTRYVEIYNSEEMPEPITLFEASIKTTCILKVASLVSEYKSMMKEEMNRPENNTFLTPEKLRQAHKAAKKTVCDKFDQALACSQSNITAKFRQDLIEQVSELFEELTTSNEKNRRHFEDIMKATEEKKNHCVFQYKAEMEKKMHSAENPPYTEHKEFFMCHEKTRNKVLQDFESSKSSTNQSVFSKMAQDLRKEVDYSFKDYDAKNKDKKASFEAFIAEKQEFSNLCKALSKQSVEGYQRDMDNEVASTKHQPFIDVQKLLQIHKEVKSNQLSRFDELKKEKFLDIFTQERQAASEKLEDSYKDYVVSCNNKRLQYESQVKAVDEKAANCIEEYRKNMNDEVNNIRYNSHYMHEKEFNKKYKDHKEGFLKKFDDSVTKNTCKLYILEKREKLIVELDNLFEKSEMDNKDNKEMRMSNIKSIAKKVGMAVGGTLAAVGCAVGAVVAAPVVGVAAAVVGAEAAVGTAAGVAAGAGALAGTGVGLGVGAGVGKAIENSKTETEDTES